MTTSMRRQSAQMAAVWEVITPIGVKTLLEPSIEMSRSRISPPASKTRWTKGATKRLNCGRKAAKTPNSSWRASSVMQPASISWVSITFKFKLTNLYAGGNSTQQDPSKMFNGLDGFAGGSFDDSDDILGMPSQSMRVTINLEDAFLEEQKIYQILEVRVLRHF